MKKFTKAEINGARAYFKSKGYQEVNASLGNIQFSYFVVPQAIEKDLPDFVIRLTGEPDDGCVFGISDSVDERYRQYAVAHEVIEFTEIGIGTPDRCTKALDEELKLVPDEIKQDYAKMRMEFFRNLIQYCSKQPALYNESDLNQFKKNAARLEETVKSYFHQ